MTGVVMWSREVTEGDYHCSPSLSVTSCHLLTAPRHLPSAPRHLPSHAVTTLPPSPRHSPYVVGEEVTGSDWGVMW